MDHEGGICELASHRSGRERHRSPLGLVARAHETRMALASFWRRLISLGGPPTSGYWTFGFRSRHLIISIALNSNQQHSKHALLFACHGVESLTTLKKTKERVHPISHLSVKSFCYSDLVQTCTYEVRSDETFAKALASGLRFQEFNIRMLMAASKYSSSLDYVVNGHPAV